MKSLARTLRRNMTEAESLLWRHLRARQLENCKFRRQMELGAYIVDFACIEKKLIVEADGAQHGETRDAERPACLNGMGYRVLRFWNHEILTETEAVHEQIREALLEPPHPGPLPRQGGIEILEGKGDT